MELDLYLKMCPEMIFKVFCCISIMVMVAILAKAVIITSKNKPKYKKEVESDDNRRNQKRSTKTDVH